MATISSGEEIARLLQDRPQNTHTYQMTQELASRIPLDSVGLRRMHDSEMQELADYLSVEVESLRGPFRVVDADSPRCGRRITFLDFAKTAITEGAHDRAELSAVLAGETDSGSPFGVETAGAR
jgi:hypothetical protein